MSNVIDFQAGLDTGEADADSIAPIVNGEDLDQVSLARPEQNLRNRTEVLRAEANENRWVRDADRVQGLQLEGGNMSWTGTVGNGGTGRLVLTAGYLTLFPFTTPGEGRGAANEGAGLVFPTRYATTQFADLNAAPFVITAKNGANGGGDQITFTVVEEVGHGPLTVAVEGDATVTNPGVQPGARNIVVTYDSAEGETFGDIATEIAATPASNAIVDITYVPGIPSAIFPVSVLTLAGAGDGVFHRITAANFASFFTAHPDNPLQEGDTLAIYYESAKLRRDSTEEQGNHLIPFASLVNLGREPAKAADAVMIGRVIDDKFVLTNGTAMAKAVAYLPAMVNQGDAGSIPVDDSGWTNISGTDLQTALDNVDTVASGIAALRADMNRGIGAPPSAGDLSSQGSEYLGVDASPFTFLNAASQSQQQVNEDIDGELSTLDTTVSSHTTTLALNVTPFTSMEALIAGTSPGDYAYLDTQDYSTNTFEVMETVSSGFNIPIDIATDGEFVYLLHGDTTAITAERRNREDLADVGVTAVDYTANLSSTPTVSHTSWGIDSNGTYVCVAYSDGTDAIFDVFNAAAGTLVGTFTVAGTPLARGVRFAGTKLYVAAAEEVYRLNPASPGVAEQTYDHSADVRSIEVIRGVVVACGNARTTNLGNAAIGDEIVGLDSNGMSPLWGAVSAIANFSSQQSAADGMYFYGVSSSTGEVVKISRWGSYDPIVGDGGTPDLIDSDNARNGYAADDRYVYMANNDDVNVYDRVLMVPVEVVIGGSATGVNGALACDCESVFQFAETSGSTYFLRRIRVPHSIRRFHRVDNATDRNLPFNLKAIPVD